MTQAQPPAFPSHSNRRLGYPGPTQEEACNPRRNSRIPPQLKKNHEVPTSSQDEELAHYGVSREVPCSALKCETVPDTLRTTPKSSPTRRVPSRGTPRVPAQLHLSPFSPPDGDRRVDPPALSGRVPGLPGTRQDEAGLTRKFETSPVGGPTCRKTPISLSALEKNPRPGHLFEGNPVGEGTTGRGTDTNVHRLETTAGCTHSSTRVLRPSEQLEGQAGFPSSDETRPDSPVPNLQGPCDLNQKWRGILRFLPLLEMRPSSIAPKPLESREAPLTPPCH